MPAPKRSGRRCPMRPGRRRPMFGRAEPYRFHRYCATRIPPPPGRHPTAKNTVHHTTRPMTPTSRITLASIASTTNPPRADSRRGFANTLIDFVRNGTASGTTRFLFNSMGQTMPESVSQEKRKLRAMLRDRLSNMPVATRTERSGEACRRLCRQDCYTHAQTVMMYMSLPNEVDLTTLAMRCFQDGKTVCVPRVDWN